MKLAAVEAFVRTLPGVTTGARWGRATWMVGDHGFAWVRPFSKADLRRFGDVTPPAGDILAVMVEDLDAKDALLALAPPGFFTIPHFAGYPAILIELGRARAAEVRRVVRTAHQLAAARAARPARRRRPAVKARRGSVDR